MKRIMIVPALLALWAQPVLAGDWDERHSYEVYEGPDPYESVDGYHVPYVAEGYVVTEDDDDDDPIAYEANCEVEREWRGGAYKETIECEED